MKRVLGLVVCVWFSVCATGELVLAKGSRKGGYVKSYTRKDGIHVSGHYRKGTQGNGSSPSNYSSPASKATANNSSSLPTALSVSGVRVVDGDTFVYQGERHRIVGIDTPEVGEANYERAKQRLSDLLNSGVVTMEFVGYDKYGRRLVKVKVNGRDIAEILKREGLQRPKGLAKPSNSYSRNQASVSLPGFSLPINPPAINSVPTNVGVIERDFIPVEATPLGEATKSAFDFVQMTSGIDDEIPEPIACIIAQNQRIIEQNDQILALLKQIANKE